MRVFIVAKPVETYVVATEAVGAPAESAADIAREIRQDLLRDVIEAPAGPLRYHRPDRPKSGPVETGV